MLLITRYTPNLRGLQNGIKFGILMWFTETADITVIDLCKLFSNFRWSTFSLPLLKSGTPLKARRRVHSVIILNIVIKFKYRRVLIIFMMQSDVKFKIWPLYARSIYILEKYVPINMKYYRGRILKTEPYVSIFYPKRVVKGPTDIFVLRKKSL